jgi:hypothetical protein
MKRESREGKTPLKSLSGSEKGRRSGLAAIDDV